MLKRENFSLGGKKLPFGALGHCYQSVSGDKVAHRAFEEDKVLREYGVFYLSEVSVTF
jgi:hypothetical protein